MSTLILTIFGSVFAKFAMWVLEKFLFGSAQDAESRALFIKLAQMLREKGIANVRSRFEAEEQLGAGGSIWDEREKNDTHN